MKIVLIGYSASGKSTLAQKLGKLYAAPVLHLDAVHHLPNWQEKDREVSRKEIEAFIDAHTSWIIDGNYTKLAYARRLQEADKIYIVALNRFACLYRAFRRFLRYRNTSRPDMAEGCKEKLDAPFIWWILWKGRIGKKRQDLRTAMEQYPNKCRLLRSQRDINALEKELGISR